MEIDKLWQQMKGKQASEEKENLVLKKLEASKNPIKTLRKNLIGNLIFGLVGVVIGVYLLVIYPEISLRLTLGLLIIIYQYFNLLMYQRIKAFDRLLDNWDQPIIPTLQQQLDLTRKTIKLIEFQTMLFLPLAYLAGLLIGGTTDEVNADDLIVNVSFLIKGMGLSLLTMPPLYFLLKWMHKKAFGDYIAQTEKILLTYEKDN
ncbi:hypothetical protein [Cecembia sp.]|uniref:hypothetical protein n=2 Tax=Cecembia sp. TaxID=1898110 RepID=UPI0025C6DD2E|nr:hypothetical protein [Cecembia sp.]